MLNLELAVEFVSGYFTAGIEGRSACTKSAVRELHRFVVSGIYPCAGSFRDAAVRVQVTGAVFVPPPAFQVEHEVDLMLDLGRSWKRAAGIRERCDLAADTLHRFNAIHPFRGGNGRVSRLLLHLMLYEMQVLSPPEHILDYIRHRRRAYLCALQAGDGGDLGFIREFVYRGVVDLRTARLIDRLDASGWLEPLVHTMHRRQLRRFVTRPRQRQHLSDREFHRLAGELAAAAERFLETNARKK